LATSVVGTAGWMLDMWYGLWEYISKLLCMYMYKETSICIFI
jgi:hypothetical protein